MTVQKVTPILNVRSVPASIKWFEAIGWKRSFTWNSGGLIDSAELEDESGPADFGGVCLNEATIFLCQDGQGPRNPEESVKAGESGTRIEKVTEGSWMSWWLESQAALDRLHALAQQLGYRILMEPVSEPWGVREFHLQHPDGHVFRCSCGIDLES